MSELINKMKNSFLELKSEYRFCKEGILMDAYEMLDEESEEHLVSED